MPEMRAKMRVSKVDKQYAGQEMLTFHAVGPNKSYPEDGTDENNTFAKFTPSATLSLTVVNPVLLGKFNEGEEYYLDFTKVAPAA